MNVTVLPQIKIAFHMWQLFPPILMLVGTIGNILSIIVLSKKSMRKSGVSMYLICLAVSDLLVLYTGLLRQWIMYMFYRDIREEHPVLCKLNMWMVYFSLYLSSWILVSATVKRTISVWLPHKVKIICTRKVFLLNILLVSLALLILNGHFLFGVGDIKIGDQEHHCVNLTQEYGTFLDKVFPWIDLWLFCLLPFLILLAGNMLIIVRLIFGKRTMYRLNLRSNEQRSERQRRTSSMTTMLLALNFVYLVCTLPISVYFIYTNNQPSTLTPEEEADQLVTYACVNLLMYLNNSTNFITYAASGRRFRAELNAIVTGQRSTHGSSFVVTSTMSNVSRSRTPGVSVRSATP